FFSSRRRHTRCYRDWSSDVCSSDLHVGEYPVEVFAEQVTNDRLQPLLQRGQLVGLDLQEPTLVLRHEREGGTPAQTGQGRVAVDDLLAKTDDYAGSARVLHDRGFECD